MRSPLWFSIFAALMLAVGWTSHLVASRVSGRGEVDVPQSCQECEHGTKKKKNGRSSRRGGSRGRWQGPYLRSIDDLSDELGFSDEQRATLSQITEEVQASIKERERESRRLLKDAHESFLSEVMTEDQRTKFNALIEKRFQEHRDREVQRTLGWFRDEGVLDEPRLLALEKVFRTYHEERGALFRQFSQSGWPERDESDAMFERLSQQRDQSLREIVGEEIAERYGQSRDRRRKSSRRH